MLIWVMLPPSCRSLERSRLWGLARGIDERLVQSDSRRQSVSVENTYDTDLPDLASCLEKLPELLETLNRLCLS